LIVVDRADLSMAEWVRPGDLVVWGQGCSEPVELTSRLLDQRAEIGGCRCFIGLSAPDTAVRVEHTDHVTFFSYIGGGVNTELDQAGALQIVPINYSRLPELLSSGRLRADVTLVQVAPPDSRGRYSLGLATDYVLAAARASRVVIAASSPLTPAVNGPALLANDIDVLVESDAAPLQWRALPAPSSTQLAVVRNVAELVDDGVTLQVGIGRLPEAALTALRGHRDLGVHSGVLTEAFIDLIECGAVTNARKTLDRGRSVAAFALGSARLNRFLHQNLEIELREASYTHGPAVLAQQHRLVALNSALEVDLTGAVNAESIGGRYVGGVGGGPEFLRGAARSQDGLPVVMLESTTAKASRIVARLTSTVSTARSDAGLVVTEHGVADLRGASLAERAERMIAIAEPSHQEQLRAEWYGLQHGGGVSLS
jgi:acyl-CoA hydrolase